ncbi:hypothetical protein HG531_001091 [Fusarium graminearum]|nr:hypothetical protein HG531_001091 [Fusarium graminearum]
MQQGSRSLRRRWLTSIGNTFKGDALLGNIGDLDTGNLGSVTHVGVDTHKNLSVAGRATRDLNVTSRHRLAVTAAAVKLAKVRDLKVLNDNSSTTVVLDHLVIGSLGTTAIYSGGLTIFLLLDAKSVFADGVPDNIVKSAATVAVNTLDLVRTWNSNS